MGKYFENLRKMETAVKQEEQSPHLNVLRSPSPSINYIFGNGQGLPYGYSAILYGVPKGGKSALVNLFIGQMHKDDPEALAVKFNTEMRDMGQMSPIWGIDPDRYLAFDDNTPTGVFDTICGPLQDAIQKGEKIKLIVIDSIQGIQGRRSQNAESIENMNPGDHAMTIQEGLKRITPVIRKHKIALLMTSHIRANLDMGPAAAYGPKTKMAGAWGLKHSAEYFILVDPNKSSDGKKDFEGNPLENKETTDAKGKSDKTGKRIYVKMAESSMGIEGRTGEFLLDYYEGIKDTWAEIAQIGINSGVVFHPESKSGEGRSNIMWQFKDKVWRGKDAYFMEVKSNTELQADILEAVRYEDIKHLLPSK